jgi:carbamate kinase
LTAPRDPRLLVVALGGAALREAGGGAGPEAWARGLSRALRPLADLAAAGFRLVITHGLAEPGEARGSRGVVPGPAVALDVLAAQTQGALGYAIAQALDALIRGTGAGPVAAVVTRVVVDAEDPAFRRPDRRLGPPVPAATARRLGRERGWRFVEEGGRGFRRVVPAPQPAGVVEAEALRRLAATGAIAIACGGGGVPVVATERGYRGVEAVVQADRAAGCLATAVAADRLVFLTGVDRVEINHGTPQALGVERLEPAEARALLGAGAFPARSIAPKVEAALAFLEAGGREALITAPGQLRAALEGRAGTRIGH